MNLELKHLAPYFPYSLDLGATAETKDQGIVLMEIYKLKGLGDDFWFDEEDNEFSFDSGYLPILRPMKDLIEPTTLNGEETTFMAELWSMKTQKGKYVFMGYEIENNTATMRFGTWQHPNDNRRLETFFDVDLEPEDITFSLIGKIDDDEKYYLLGNEFKMYQKLFEWHFDVFGLIEKGLAIDINVIK